MTRTTPKKDAPLFTFAVVADTHINPEDDRTSSPWQTNRLANARIRAVVAQINVLDPDFVVHLGDIVHPVPSQPTYATAAKRFRALFADLRAPLHLVSGNHDVGDKPTPWMPAASVDARFLALYREHFGKDFFAFDHRDCRFVIMNSQILNSGLPDEQTQWGWLDAQLATDRRIFLFKHYPPFLHDAEEDEHYDNLAEPARSRFLGLLHRHHVEALFCGHVHNFFYNRIGATDCYVLPATSAVRHDYMELFPVPPVENEHGRDARSKLGFFLVEVFPTGHVAHWIRSWGETDPARATEGLRPPRTHARGAIAAPIGVDLRHGWAEPIAIPYTGVVDEFGRKLVRNDYFVAALWELGLRNLRIPIQDLVNPAAAGRVAELAALGHRLTVFVFGLPDARQKALLARLSASVDGLEIIERGPAIPEIAESAAALRSELGIPVFLSKLRVSAETERDKGHFAHFIRHGFLASETTAAPAGIDGLVYRVDRDEAPWPTLHAIAEAAGAAGRRAIVHVRLAGNDPAKDMTDDADCARRVADTVLAAWALGDQLSVFLDTFADHDRGYYPRHGLVDRAYDPRPAAKVLKHLVEMLHEAERHRTSITADGEARIMSAPGQQFLVLLPNSQQCESAFSLPWELEPAVDALRGMRLDTGAKITARIRRTGDALSIGWSERSSGLPVLIFVSDEPAEVVRSRLGAGPSR